MAKHYICEVCGYEYNPADGDPDKEVTIKLQKLTGRRPTVLNASVVAGGDYELPFTVNDGWGEYRLTVNRPSTTDVINITNLGIYSVADTPATGVQSLLPSAADDTPAAIYSPTGIRQNHVQMGMNIIRTADGTVKKILVK